jgi:hypothetical protein
VSRRPVTRRLAFFLTLAATVLMAGLTGAGPARADTTPAVSGSDWLYGNGVNACSASTDPTCGGDTHVGGVSSNWWQCVELAQRLYYRRGWYTANNGIFSGVSYAYQIYGQASSLGMTAHANGSGYIPVPGDMIVHTSADGNGAGHVSLVDRVDGSTVYAAEQNINNAADIGTYSLSGSTLSRTGMHIQGVVHDPDNPNVNGAQLLGDVTGDGKADAVVFYKASGTWFVEPSNGSGFTSAQQWIAGFGAGSTKQFLADVNGDGKADAIAYWSGSGDYYVALSNGSGFGSPTRWSTGQIGSSTEQFMGDVNGDGYADAVAGTIKSTGTWYVALSNGSNGFGSFSTWKTGHGAGSTRQFVADVTGDGKADAVAYWSSNGWWYVAPSTGSSFGGASQWSTGQITSSTNQMLGDVTGDGKADAIAGVFPSNGTWYVSPSNGSSAFTGFSQWTTGHGAGSDQQFTADVTGDGKADAVVYFGGTNGWWYVAPSTGSAFGGASQWASSFGVGS